MMIRGAANGQAVCSSLPGSFLASKIIRSYGFYINQVFAYKAKIGKFLRIPAFFNSYWKLFSIIISQVNFCFMIVGSASTHP